MTLNKELVKQIRAADRPRHFLFAMGQVDELKLTLNKPGKEELQEVKAVAGPDAEVLRGRAELEIIDKEETLVFYLLKPQRHPQLDRKLKRTIKESAGLNLEVLIRDLEEFKIPDAELAEAGQLQAGQQPADPLKPEYDALAASVLDDVTTLKKVNPELAAKLKTKYDEVVLSVQDGTGYKSAIKSLGKIRELSEKSFGKVTSDQKAVAEKAAYKSLREHLASAFQKLQLLNPSVADKLNSYITDAEALVDDSFPENKRDYKAATKKLIKLSHVLARGLDNVVEPTAADDKARLRAAVTAPREYEMLYGECRTIVKNLVKRLSDSPKLKSYRERVTQVANLARVYDYDQALPQIKAVHEEISKLGESVRQYFKKLASLDEVLNDVYAARQPGFAPARIQQLRDYRAGVERFANQFNFKAASDGCMGLEEQARLALSERQTFIEAHGETAALLNQAEGKLADDKYTALEAFFITAADMFESGSGSPSQAYDIITSVGAELRKALRAQEVVKDSGQRVTETLEGGSRDARRLRYKLELDGARKALLVIGDHDPDTGDALSARLAKVTEAQTKSLTKAEGLLTPLLKDIQAAMAAVRKGMNAGDWESPDQPDKTPPPPSLKEWKDEIDDNGLLKKVKVGKQLAAGGYGAIYRLDPDDRRQGDDLPPLVVKLPLSDEPNAKAEALEDFRKEAEIYAKIGDHPNILKCLGLRKVGDAEGLVMEAVRGTTTDKFFADLRARAAEGELSEAEFWSTIQYTIGKTMSALAHIHEAGLAHNDLKPQNIMIDQVTGDVKVIDVGTANLQGEVVEGVDNPIFQAPEQLKKQGSSGQTDALPVGGVAYTAATGQGFHFGDKDGMMSAFMADIDEAMLKYGARRGDDADDAAISLATEEETVRSVNRRGEDDPKGDILLRDPSKSAGRSAYTDFINAIMHPDPTKRLSPKQALEHPFLRDPMLPEEQVRAVIQDASKGKALPGEEPLRERLGDVFRKSAAKVDAWDDRIAELKETLKLDPTAVPGDKLIAKREELAKQLETLDSDRVQIQRAIDVLKDLIANAREESTEIYFNDNKNLDRLRKQDSVMRELRPGLAALLVAVKDSFDLWTVDELAETINADEVQKRIAGLQASREALAQEVDDVVNHPAPALFDHLRHLDRLQRQVETVRSNAAVEKKLLLNLARRKPTTPELKHVSKQLSDHFQLLAPIVDEVKRARDDAVRHAAYLERKINETLVPEYESLATTFETLKQAHAATTNEFEEIVMAPRDTPDAMLAFEKARNEFDVDEDAYQDRLADLIAKAEEQQANVLKQQKELGKLGVTGVANPLNTLSKLYKSLSRLKVKMTV